VKPVLVASTVPAVAVCSALRVAALLAPFAGVVLVEAFPERVPADGLWLDGLWLECTATELLGVAFDEEDDPHAATSSVMPATPAIFAAFPLSCGPMASSPFRVEARVYPLARPLNPES
jgi:hypothetical protein